MSIPADGRDGAIAHITEFVDGYASKATRTAYRSDLSLWATYYLRCDRDLFEVVGLTSRATPDSWKPPGSRRPRSTGDWRPSPGSIGGRWTGGS